MEHRGKLCHDKRHSLRARFPIDCTEFVRSVQKANNFEMLDIIKVYVMIFLNTYLLEI